MRNSVMHSRRANRNDLQHLWQNVRLFAVCSLTPTLMLLGGCGGGGGDNSSSAKPASTTGGATGNSSEVVDIEALSTTSNAFYLSVDERITSDAYINELTGGTTTAAWNLKSSAALTPGMKITFFGQGIGCPLSLKDGPVSSGSAGDFALAVQRTGVPAEATLSSTRWTPSRDTSNCSSSAANEAGPHWIYFNPASSSGAIAEYTHAGPGAGGIVLEPYGVAGADGAGANSYITSSFVGFRMKWWAADAITPWSSADGVARFVSTQSVGSYKAPSSASGTIQVKQQLIVSLINTDCQKNIASLGGPCQIQYVLNTAIMRGGVSDWSSYWPVAEASVWYDPVQGGMPIVASQLPAKGGVSSEVTSGLAVLSSQAGATQHMNFNRQNFDARVTFDQLKNAIKIVAAKKAGVSVDVLTDTMVENAWGASWNDPSSWVLVSTSVGQEVYNSAFNNVESYIGGGFSTIYVGPK